MAITYFGSVGVPAASGGTNTANPTTIAPVANMVAGDLCVVIAQGRAANLVMSVSNTGGQTWTTEAAVTGGTPALTARIFWCRFNGTWSTSPSFTIGSTLCNTVVMHVFRPTAGANTWQVNVALASGAFATPTGPPYNVVRAGVTTTAASTVTLAGWHTNDDDWWPTVAGTGWAKTGLDDYRNTSGSDSSAAFAHYIATSAGSTGNVTRTQTTNGPENGHYWIMSWEEVGGGPETFDESVTESVGFSEALARTRDGAASVSESLAAADTGARIRDTSSTANETMAVADLVDRGKQQDLSIQESVTLSDTLARIATQEKALTESATLTDTAAKNFVTDAAANETFAAAETLARGLEMNDSVSEAVGVADSDTRILNILKDVEELVAFLDSLDPEGTFSTTVTELMTIGDLIVGGLDLLSSLNEGVTADSITTSIISQDVVVNEIVAFLEAVNASGVWTASRIESFDLQDTHGAEAILHVQYVEAVALLDSVMEEVVTGFFETIAEEVSISDVVEALVLNNRFMRNIHRMEGSVVTRILGEPASLVVEGSEPGSRVVKSTDKPKFKI
jgi:hypothetical protein